MGIRIHAILLSCIAVLLLIQLSSMRDFDAEKPNRVLHLIEDLSQLDTQSEQIMLQIYSRSVFNYDEFSADVGQMQGILDQVTLELSDKNLFTEELEALKQSVGLQKKGANEFKSSFAILANSVRYFPTLISQLQKERPDLSIWLTELNRDVFQWQLYPDDREAYDRIVEASEQIKTYGLTQLSRHLQLILDYGPRVAEAMSEVIGCGAAENAHLLSVAYERHFTTQVQKNQRDQILIIMLGVVLLLYMFLLLYFRQRDALRLVESEDRFRMLFDLIPDGVGVHQNGRWIYCNPALVEMFGAQSEGELIGSSVVDRVHPDMRENVATRIELETKELKPAPLMLQKNLRMDGGEFFGEVQGIPFIEHDQPVAMAVIRDVTDRIQAEADAEKSRQNLQAVVDNSTAVLYQKDVDGRYMLINRYYEEVMHVQSEHVIGKTDHELFPAEVAERLRADDLKVIEAGEPMKFDEEVELADGVHTFVSIKVPLKDEKGRVESVFGLSTDVTALINAEREKSEAQSKMEHVQRLESLGILAGGIAHDFNNILTAVMGNAAMASRNMDDKSPAKEFLERIETSTQRASDLCKQMLAYSGKGRFVVKSINLSELVEEMTRLMEVSIEKNVVIKYHLADNLPAVEADAAQIQQVILNLITNANEAIESKSGVISFTTGVMHADQAYLSQTITEAELPDGRYVFMEVSDTGCGMSAVVMNKIFDPFFTTKFTGRGLGMSAVLGIVRGHQGALRVYSEVGKGTTFKILLPASEHAFISSENQDIAEDDWKASGTILVVDDEETIREVATMMLEDMGFKTLSAEDGAEALHVYHAHESEVVGVLLDMTMPKMDGKECFRELRRINPDVKVILSSGYNEQDATSRFVGQGLAGFLQKPYTPEALREKLRGMLVDQEQAE